MRPNRNMRIGFAIIGGVILILIMLVIFRAINANRVAPTEAETPNVANSVTPVSYNSNRMSAVALVDLPELSIITRDMFRLEELPEGAPTTGLVTNLDSQAIGFITRRAIRKNDPLRLNDLVGHISDVGIAGALSPGTRAMILPIPAKPTFHDLVKIGGYVDVIAAFDSQESRTIVESVRVLAVDVFGSDYPQQANIAMRGPYKAPPKKAGSAAGATAPATSTPAPTQAAPGQPAAPAQPAPAKEEEGDPPPAPTPAITLEVTPEQANRILLAQNSGGVLDFILVPRPIYIAPGLPGSTTGAASPVRAVSVTRAQLAPYAEGKKNAGGTKKAASAGDKSSGGSRNGGTRVAAEVYDYPTPDLPAPAPQSNIRDLPPAEVNAPASRPTYEIPIYADGTKVRTDVVLKPKE